MPLNVITSENAKLHELLGLPKADYSFALSGSHRCRSLQ